MKKILEDLKLGNTVLFNNPHWGGWIPITMTKDFFEEDPNDFKPIELTKDILELNEFTYRNALPDYVIPGLFEWVSKDGRIILRNDKNYINSHNTWSIHVDNEEMESVCNAELSYLHELENILRHCGIDLKFKLI